MKKPIYLFWRLSKGVPVFYKVIRGFVVEKRTVKKTVVVWKGSDLKQLERKYPRVRSAEGVDLDRLRTVKTKDDQVFTTVFCRRRDETEKWKMMDDPRPIVFQTPVREHGRMS